MLHADVFSVQMQSDSVIVSDDGQGVLGLGSRFKMHRTAVAGSAPGLEAFADVVVGDDGRLFLEVGVSTDVVTMIVRVDDEPHRLVVDAFQRGLNLFGQRGALVVNQQDAVIADGSADVSASAFEHVDIAGDFADLDLDLAEVLVLSSRGP